MYRSHPQTHAVLQTAVRRGEIGELRLIRSSFCYRTTRIAGQHPLPRATSPAGR